MSGKISEAMSRALREWPTAFARGVTQQEHAEAFGLDRTSFWRALERRPGLPRTIGGWPKGKSRKA